MFYECFNNMLDLATSSEVAIKPDLILAAKFGDACIHTQGSGRYQIAFIGTERQWIEYKAKELGFSHRVKVRQQAANAYGKKPIHHFCTTTSNQITEVYKLTKLEAIKQLGIAELIVWYLDDGSWHKGHNTMHLYSNNLTREENLVLIEHINTLYGISPRLAVDRKKDGRQYYYLYFGTKLSKLFSKDVKEFLILNNLSCFYYKVGMAERSSTSAIST